MISTLKDYQVDHQIDQEKFKEIYSTNNEVNIYLSEDEDEKDAIDKCPQFIKMTEAKTHFELFDFSNIDQNQYLKHHLIKIQTR